MIYKRKRSVREKPFDVSTWHRSLLCVAGLLFALQIGRAQSILGTNLIVNGNAEAGPAGAPTKLPTSIPGWTRTGNANVLPYGLPGYLLLSDPAPPDHGFQYFFSGSLGGSSTLTQTIDVSSAASVISGGNVRYTASAYLGSSANTSTVAQVVVAFQNGSGQTFTSATLGPLSYPGTGMTLQQQIGLVPSGTVSITVTLSFSAGDQAAADSLSLVLSTLGTSPESVLGTNLVVNGGAEAGPAAAYPATTLYVPGWSTINNASVCPYGEPDSIQVSDPGPPDRGVNLFCEGYGRPGIFYQDLDVSAAAALIDTGQVTYQISAWLGALDGDASATVTYEFFDWSNPPMQLAPTGQLGPANEHGTALVETSDAGAVPSGTRRVHIALNVGSTALADDIAFTLAAPSGPPVIDAGGIVSASAFGGFTSIAPGSWIEIYGVNLASATQGWFGSDFTNGVAPTMLGDVTVSVGGTAAFIDYISPGQVNALVPSDAPVSSGWVYITLTNPNGTSEGFPIYVNQTQPGLLAPSTFVVSGKQYVAALLSDGSFALPENAIPGVASRPAVPGETATIYGVGFGPVIPDFPAGTVVTAENSLLTAPQFLFGTTSATLSYDGLAPSLTGLYQFNVVVPNVSANNAVPLSFNLVGVKGSQALYIAVGN